MTPHALLAAEVVAGGVPLRPVEVERYADPDPFGHRHPVQLLRHRWYFHRVNPRGGYRGGSFKGLDLSAGDGKRHVGLLLRAVAHPDGTRTDGPSRLVDLLLTLTGFASVAALDTAVGDRPATDPASPLHLRPGTKPPEVYRTARVGLGLKRFRPEPGHPMVTWLAARERYLTDPARTRTGRVQLAVRGLTETPGPSVRRWRAWHEAGGDPAGWYGRELTPEGLCRLLGWSDRAAAASGSPEA